MKTIFRFLALALTILGWSHAQTITSTSAPRQVVGKGQSLVLSITATGATSYQWKRNGATISGATGTSYTITNASMRDAGYYIAVASAGTTSVQSAPIFVNVSYASTQVLAWGSNYYGEVTVPAGLNTAVAVSAGYTFGMALKADGTVTAWGDNSYGQTTIPSGLSNVVAISAGGYHALALKSDGTVVAWGSNGSGQTSVPSGLTGVVAIAAGGSHSLVLKSDGTLVGWGSNSYNQAGTPTGLNNVTGIAAGYAHSLALKADGTVTGWGYNSDGEVTIPSTLNGVASIAAGEYNSGAVKTDGTVSLWGWSAYYSTSTVLGSNVVALGLSYYQAVALKADGTLAWGGYNYGYAPPSGVTSIVGLSVNYATLGLALRDSSADTAPSITSQPVGGAYNLGQSATLSVVATAGTASIGYQWCKDGTAIAGAYGASYTIAEVTSSSAGNYTVVASNSLGNVTSSVATVAVNAAPIVGPNAGGRYPISAGQGLTLTLNSSISSSATVQWQKNGVAIAGATSRSYSITNATIASAGYYQAVYTIGTSQTISGAIFVQIASVTQVVPWGGISLPSGLTGVTSLGARGYYGIASKTDGTVVEWGTSYYSATLPNGLGNVVAVAQGTSHALALRADGTVIAWNPSYSYGTSNTPPDGLTNVVAVAAGSYHSLALKGDGTVVAWGSTTGGATAVPAGLSSVVAIAGGNGFSLALRSDGTVVGWGANDSGQSSVPAGLNNVVAISAGSSHSVALKSDGTVVTWGNSSYAGPIPSGLSGVVAIAAGDYYTYALKSDGTIVGWGPSYYGATPPPAVQKVLGLATGAGFGLLLRDASLDTVPVITTPPANTTAYTGQNLTLSVTAGGGTASLAYQWRKGGIFIPGATTSTLPLTQVTTAAAGSYDVVVTDQLGSTTSQAATLTVNATSAVTMVTAARQVLAAGQSLTLTPSVAMPGPVNYQWKRNGASIAGATNATYTISNANWLSGGVYQVVAANSVGPALSSPVFVNLSLNPQVRAWGDNSYGQTTLPTGLTNVVAVAVGYYHSLALLADGTVTAWGGSGYYSYGQSVVPTGLNNVVAISAGANYSMALRADGTVATWGYINYTPSTATSVVAIVAGQSYAMALRQDGTVVAWDTSGVRTDGPTTLTQVVALCDGYAVKSDGTVVSFSGTMPPSTLSGVIAVAASSDGLALKSDGTVVGWGSNYYGVANVPSGLSNVVAIAANGGVAYALKNDGSVFAWGGGNSVLSSGAQSIAPVYALASGYQHDLALRNAANDVAPVITVQPTSTSVNVGGNVTLSVTATGTPPPTYQWAKNGNNIYGATNASLTLTGVFTSNAGIYTVTVTNTLGSVTSTAATLTVNPSLSQRALIVGSGHVTLAGDNPIVSGSFTVEGTLSKQMLVRAVGPTLTTFGISDAVPNPALTIYTASGNVTASNDDWSLASNASQVTTVAQSVGAFALPSGSKDAAVLASFAPGTYRVAVTSGSGAGGSALLEVYDADSNPRLVYLATRAKVGTGAKALVQGFVVSGVTSGRSYLIRALGPSLGSPLALADPQLAVFDANNALLASNDNWGGDSAVTSLATLVGAMPLDSGSKDAAVSFVPPAGGTYTVQVTGTGNTTGVALLEIFEADAQRATAMNPAIVSNPDPVTALAGNPATFGVVTTGLPSPSYQWKKDGVAISGATAASYSISAVQSTDAGSYTVVATNSGGSATSTAAALTVAQLVATHGYAGAGYYAGGTVTITNTLTYTGTPASLAWSATIPTGWSYASGGGSEGDVKPVASATGTLDWAWTTPPASPVTFTYTLNVPSTDTVAKTIAATGSVRASSGTQSAAATPGSLSVPLAPTLHSADTDSDGKISLVELTRVIELFNTRNGTSRTGCYAVATTTTEDGFAPDPLRSPADTVTLTRYHASDENHDGRIGLLELTRIIELYNYRTGTSRTGQYHVQSGTEDGFAPGP